jgi:hypothetical protein
MTYNTSPTSNANNPFEDYGAEEAARDDLAFERGDMFHDWYYSELTKLERGEASQLRRVGRDRFICLVPQWSKDSDRSTQHVHLAPDRKQLTQFTETLFKHASSGTYVSLRSFRDKGEKNQKPFKITPHKLNGDFNALIDDAWDDASMAANAGEKVVFCPPVATFTNSKHAGEDDLADGLVISVECDEHAQEGRNKLKSLLGPALLLWRAAATGLIQRPARCGRDCMCTIS